MMGFLSNLLRGNSQKKSSVKTKSELEQKDSMNADLIQEYKNKYSWRFRMPTINDKVREKQFYIYIYIIYAQVLGCFALQFSLWHGGSTKQIKSF